MSGPGTPGQGVHGPQGAAAGSAPHPYTSLQPGLVSDLTASSRQPLLLSHVQCLAGCGVPILIFPCSSCSWLPLWVLSP